MSADARGTYGPGQSLLRIVGHGALLFALPYLVVASGLTLFETSEVSSTKGSFAALAGTLLAPLLLLHLVGTVRKARAQLAVLGAAGASTPRARLDAVARATEVVTSRGILALVSGLGFLVLSLAFRWAELGVMAVLALSAFYLVVSASAFLSSFVIRRFSSDAFARGAVVHRRYEPGIARAGDTVREVLDLRGVPVPPGFFLTMAGSLPSRLGTEIRHVVLPRSRSESLSLSVPLRRTPRGTYDAPPLQIAFTDLLGLTRATIPSLATARLRVLPATGPLEIVTPPPSSAEELDVLSRPHRFPTEDLFRFRDYVRGDDTRRIHWEASLRARRMIVRTPESRETSGKRVVVALDTWVPPDWLPHTSVLDDALDALVETWLSIARRLVEQGEEVSLLLVARGDDGTVGPELVPASGPMAHGLDAGARAAWQARVPIEALLDGGVASASRAGGAAFDGAIVVTMRLTPPALLRVARETTWVHYDVAAALGPAPRSALDLWIDWDDSGRTAGPTQLLSRALFLPHPVGAEENGLVARARAMVRRLEDRGHRLALRARAVDAGERALGALLRLPDAVYRLEHVGGVRRLVGLKGRGGA